MLGAEFITAIAGDAFLLVQAGDPFHGKSPGWAMLNTDLAPGASFRVYLQTRFGLGAVKDPID